MKNSARLLRLSAPAFFTQPLPSSFRFELSYNERQLAPIQPPIRSDHAIVPSRNISHAPSVGVAVVPAETRKQPASRMRQPPIWRLRHHEHHIAVERHLKGRPDLRLQIALSFVYMGILIERYPFAVAAHLLS